MKLFAENFRNMKHGASTWTNGQWTTDDGPYLVSCLWSVIEGWGESCDIISAPVVKRHILPGTGNKRP